MEEFLTCDFFFVLKREKKENGAMKMYGENENYFEQENNKLFFFGKQLFSS